MRVIDRNLHDFGEGGRENNEKERTFIEERETLMVKCNFLECSQLFGSQSNGKNKETRTTELINAV